MKLKQLGQANNKKHIKCELNLFLWYKYLSLSFQIPQSHNAAGKADLMLCVSFLSELVKSKTRRAHSYKKLENFKCRNKIGLFAMGLQIIVRKLVQHFWL